MTLARRLAIRLLRAELDAREAAARKLAAGAYQEGGAGRRGRAWWDGYAHGVAAIAKNHQGVL